MDEIRAIVRKARAKAGRSRTLKARAINEREDNALEDLLDLEISDDKAMATPASTRRSSRKCIADSGALSYMTDQLSLFRGTLKKKARSSSILDIGGIRLRIEGVSEVRIQTEGGEMTLLNVLYIPGLGTNLLSEGALYKAGLHRSFDKGTMYMRAEDGSLVLKTVKRDSIYIINWISKDVRHIIFPAESAIEASDFSLKPPCIPTEENVPRTIHIYTHIPSNTQPSPNISKLVENFSSPYSSSRSRYQLWHRRFAYMSEKKL
jgi:hypothetical protein